MVIPEYILFIDTETSGMPKRWSVPTSIVNKWPYILQIAWVIFTKKGEKVVSRNFYIDAGNIFIDQASILLHGITNQFLNEKGIKRKKVMRLLSKDLEKYQPLIVGHFLEFDIRMIEVGFTRAKVKQNFFHLPKFCTMVFSQNLRNASFTPKFMRLNELYKFLFGKEPENFHNAIDDAFATKECFFELMNRGLVNEEIIKEQQKQFFTLPRRKKIIYFSIAIVFAAIILYAVLKSLRLLN